MKKEIRNRLLSILGVSTFLILMTAFVYIPNNESMAAALGFINQVKNFYMEDLSEGVLLKNAIPVTDSEGLENDPYSFQVVNNSNKNITYNIVFKNNEEKAKERGKEVLPSKYLRYAISDSNDTNLEAKTLTDDGILLTTTITPHSKVVFNFRMWLDFNSDEGAMDKIFIGTIELEEVK